jgi:hypothetical protein
MRIILAKAACNEWEVCGGDVSQAFLYPGALADLLINHRMLLTRSTTRSTAIACYSIGSYIYGLHVTVHLPFTS